MKLTAIAMAGVLAVLLTSGWCTAALASPVHTFLYELAGPKGGNKFSNPAGVAVDSHGDIYVSNRATGEIDILDPTGEPITQLEGFNSPKGIDVDSKGNLYVAIGTPGSPNGKVVLLSPSAFPPVQGTQYTEVQAITEGGAGGIKSVAVSRSDDRVYVDIGSGVQVLASATSGSAKVAECGAGSSYGVEVEESTGNIFVVQNEPTGFINILSPAPPCNTKISSINGTEEKGLGENIALNQADGHVAIFVRGQFGVSAGYVSEFDSAGKRIESAQIGPGFGTQESSLNGIFEVDLAFDNGALSPNKGDVYIVSGSSTPPRLYAYGPLEEPRPIVKTGAATNATETSATLNGTLNPHGLEVKTCVFEYMSEAAYEEEGGKFTGPEVESIPCSETSGQIGSGNSPVPVHADLSGLSPDRYRFRLTAENENPGPVSGEVNAFGAPEVATEGVSPIGFTEARLHATINPEGLATTYVVEYGLTEAYDAVTNLATIPTGIEGVPVAVDLGELEPGTRYHYRFVAENEMGPVADSDHTFITSTEPSVEGCPNSGMRTGFSARLPDCRAYELVTSAQLGGASPVWTGGDESTSGFASLLATEDGESVVFQTSATLPGTEGSGVIDGHHAVRGPAGWTTFLISPSSTQGLGTSPGGVSEDHRYSFWSVSGSVGSLAIGPGGNAAHYIRLPAPEASSACSPEPGGYFELVGCGSEGSDPAALGRWISKGASHIVFTSRAQLEPGAQPSLAVGLSENIYDRSPGGETRVVSLLPGDVTPAPGSTVFYAGTSRGGSSVAFTAEGTLYARRSANTLAIAEGDPAFAGLSSDGRRVFYAVGGGLFMCDLDVGSCTGPDATQAPTEIASGGDSSFVNVSADGSHVYFTSTEALTGSEENEAGEVAEVGQHNFYLWDAEEDSVKFITQLAASDLVEFEGTTAVNLANWLRVAKEGRFANGPGADPSRTTPDGRVLVFQSHGSLTGVDTGGHSQVFRYDEADGSLTCVSCGQNEVPPQSDATLENVAPEPEVGQPIGAIVRLANVSADGDTVFFQTTDPLVPGDVNGVQDVYEWHEGVVSLISSGESPWRSFLYAMNADGKDVFFATRQALLPSDENEGSPSIYDARVDGGFAEPAVTGGCTGEACQGAPGSSPFGGLAPATLGIGEESGPPRRLHCRKGRHRVSRGGVSRCVKNRKHRRARGHSHRRRHR